MPICFCAIGCHHSTFNRLFGCVFLVWRHHLRKVNKLSVRTFRRFFCNFLIFCDVPQHSNRFDYIKACDQQFTLTTKESLHITFKRPKFIKDWYFFVQEANAGNRRAARSVATRLGSRGVGSKLCRHELGRLCVCVCVCVSVRGLTPTLLHGPGCN